MNLAPSAWSFATRPPPLPADEVHLWRANLPHADLPRLQPHLSSCELIRAERFHFAADRERFIAARGILRQVLAGYLDLAPENLRFTAGPHGRPELAGICSALRFNLSHSGDLMLLAVAHTRAIGVDLELMQDNVPFQTLADHYFEPEQAWKLRLLPPAERAATFYDLWTSTEACLKASGLGLSKGTRVAEPDRWSLRKLMPAPGYAAALAVEGGSYELNTWSWLN
ncbi:MAG TPA: 4'-phosphopantetheinyl transferase superfamily protein [Chthoniobacteraceae bacterium]